MNRTFNSINGRSSSNSVFRNAHNSPVQLSQASNDNNIWEVVSGHIMPVDGHSDDFGNHRNMFVPADGQANNNGVPLKTQSEKDARVDVDLDSDDNSLWDDVNGKFTEAEDNEGD